MAVFRLFSSYRARAGISSKPILMNDVTSLTYDHVFETTSSLEDLIGSRNLIICLTENALDLYHLLVSVIDSGNIPLLVDHQIDDISLASILEKYRANYLVVPINHNITRESSTILLCKGKFCLIKMRNTNSRKIKLRDLAILLPTSGSTGSSRYVRVSYTNLQSQAKAIAQYLNLTNKSKTLSTLPVSYSFGFSIFNSFLYARGLIYVSDMTPLSKGYWDLLDDQRISSISGVPFSFEIWKRMGFLDRKLQHLNTITQAGGNLDKKTKLEFLEYCDSNDKQFFVMYGQTEATARMSYVPPFRLRDKIESIGLPIPGGRLTIRNEQGSLINKPNLVGELVYAGENVTLGYSTNFLDLEFPDANKGILNTGDLGFYDEEGFFYITGRLKRIAKINGNRINLDEIDRELNRIGIMAVTIDRSNRLHVYTESHGSTQKILDFFQSHVRILKNCVKVFQLEALPRLSNGKLDYKGFDKLDEMDSRVF
jgi:long-chain acyl-CoA synthetase